ncbi:MAG: autotransporter-associated beta strand repeat-containing protein [Planctomycetia bacterium]|nr:autotransporter-associated beta strand repeat-containing protein [Planctomycetia bacterium]
MSQSATAATGTWTGANNATWNSSATNWSGVSGTPWDSTNGPANDAVFNTGGTPNAYVSGTVYSKSIAFPLTAILWSSTTTPSGISLSGNSTLSAASGRTGFIYASLYGSGTLTKSDAGDIAINNQVGFNANTFNGAVVVDAGRLYLNGGAAGRALPFASSYTINSGATIAMQGNDPMGSGPITVNSGTLRHEVGNAQFQSVGALTLNGGTVLSAQGAGASFQGLALNGNVTVGGASASTIGTQESTDNGVHLFFNASNPAQQRTFNVADATGDLGADLLVSASLLNSSHTGTAAGLIKTGAGLMVLTGSNGYTGATTISNGILVFQNKNTRAGGSAVTAAAASTVGLGVGAGGVSDYSDSDVASLFNSTLSGFTLNAASGVAIDTTAGNFTQSTALTAARALTKLGSNTLTLTGSNTYSGNTTIGAGTLQIGNGGTTGSLSSASAISGSAGTAIAFNRSDDLTFGNTISGGVGLTKNAANAVRLTGAVSYTGTTNITAGVLDFGFVSGTTTWTAPIIGSSGTFRYSGTGALALSASVGGANSFTGAVVVDSGVLQMGLRDSSQSRGFSNASSFTVNSGATLAVTRDSMSNSAPITLNSGTLTAGSVGGSSDFYQALGPITMNAGTIITGQGIGASFNSYGLNGDVTVAGSAASQILAGIGSNNGVHLAFNAASGASRTFTVADVTSSAAADLTVSAALLNSSHSSGTMNLVKAGAGTMVLAATNLYTGTTFVNAGTLQIGSGSTAGSIDAASAVTGSAGTSLVFNRSDSLTFANAVSGGLAVTKSGAGALTLTGSSSYTGATTLNAGTLQIGNGGATGSLSSASAISGAAGTTLGFNRSDNITVANTISGSLGITKNGAGAVRLTGPVTSTGTTTIAAGTLDLGFVSGTTTWTAPIVGSGGTFRYSGSGTLLVAGTSFGANSFTGAVVVDSGVLQTGAIDFSQGRGFSNASSFTVNAGATLAIAREANNAAAPVTLNSGTLTAGTLGGSSAVFQVLGAVAMNAGSMITGQGIGSPYNTYALDGNVTVAGSGASQILAGAGSFNGVHLTWNAAAGASRTFTVNDATSSSAVDLMVAAALLNSGNTSNAAGLVKAGLGTMRLTGINTYTGTTAVNAGTLLVDGNNSAATGAVTVASGATLGGSGTLGGAVTVDGILSPGSSPGVLTAPSILLGGSSTSIFEIDGTVRGTGYDGVTITQSGGLTYGGVLSLVFSGTFANDTTFDLFSFSGAPLGSFSSLTASGHYGSLTFTDNGSGVWTSGSTSVAGQTMTFTQATGDLVIVPEPGALALAAAGVGLAAAWARRRCRT